MLVKMLRIVILTLLLILLSSVNIIKANALKVEPKVVWVNSDEKIYRDLGMYEHYFNDGTYIKVFAYITKKINTNPNYRGFRYVYTLVAQSRSFNGNRTCETWLYNTKIYLDNKEISYNQFPQGATMFIQTSPSEVYKWFTNDEDIPPFYMQWGNSIYENR